MKSALSRILAASSLVAFGLALASLLVCLIAFMSPGSAFAAGTVYTVPASIDHSGATDASEAIQRFLGTVPAGTQGSPVTVRFQPGGNYLINHTLFLRTEKPNLDSVGMWYFLPAMSLDHVRVDLNGSTLRQTTTDLHDYALRPNAKGKLVKIDRRLAGDPLISTNGATDLEIFNGTLIGSNADGQYHPSRESWAGIRVFANSPTGRVNHVWLHELKISHTWGDWVYLHAMTNRGSYLTDVRIENNVMDNAGRQGLAIMGVGDPTACPTPPANASLDVKYCDADKDYERGLIVRNNKFLGAERMLFDLENGNYTHVWIDHNDGNTGDLGYFWAEGGVNGLAADHVRITNNHLTHGHFRITISTLSPKPRDVARVENNVSDSCTLAKGRLIKLANFSRMSLTNNIEHVVPFLTDPPFFAGGRGADHTVSGNQWLTSLPAGC